MGKIIIENLQKSFGSLEIIKDLSLTIEEGEFCVFVGPSGSGKSTLLRLIAGLETATGGTISIDGRDVTKAESYDRGLSMVFQSYALYPHMSVRENIAFALRTAKMPQDQINTRIAEAARMLKLEPYLDRKPSALSGGQRQRVAIGRAIVREPSAFLFDEPLSNLDAALRSETRLEIATLHRTLGATMIYVTHDQIEAMTLADRIIVLDGGRIMQAGAPRVLYDRPANTFVAQFIGSPKMNLIPLQGTGLTAPQGAFQIGVRPEHLRLSDLNEAAFTGIVESVEFHGADLSVFVQAGAAGRINLRLEGAVSVSLGETVGIGFAPQHAHYFDQNGQRV